MKQRIYAKSVGNENACIFIPENSDIPSTHTSCKPLKPKDGFTVDWNESGNKWEYNEIPQEDPLQ